MSTKTITLTVHQVLDLLSAVQVAHHSDRRFRETLLGMNGVDSLLESNQRDIDRYSALHILLNEQAFDSTPLSTLDQTYDKETPA